MLCHGAVKAKLGSRRVKRGMAMTWTPAPLSPSDRPLPMQQHPAYGATCQALGVDVLTLALDDRGMPMASAQVLVRRWPLLGRFALLSRGPVWDYRLDPAVRRAALKDLVARLSARFAGVMVTPERSFGTDPLAGAGLLEMVTPHHLAEIDLSPTEAERRAALDPKWRNRLGRAERLGLDTRVEPLPPTGDHWLLRAEAEQAQDRRYARLPPRFATAWAAANPGGAVVFALYRFGLPAAGILILLHAPTASYQAGWTGPAGRAVSAHNLLLWQAGCWLAAQGYRSLDLGNLDTETTPGLARFKLAAGGRPVMLGSTWMRAPGTGLIARVAAAMPHRRKEKGPVPIRSRALS